MLPGWCRGRPRRRPRWWPEGEQWPPPTWSSPAARRFRRRFAVGALAVFALVSAVAIGIGKAIGDPDEGRPDRGRGPFGLVFAVAGAAMISGAATRRAYRRLAAPAGELLEAADRVGDGDYDVRVEPRGPRELRDLMARFNDMTERLRMGEEQRRRVLADVTHELRTPLMVLQSGLEAQLDGIHPRDDEHLSSLLEETRMLALLVEDLHTLALTEAGRLSLHREQADPAALAEESVDAIATAAAAKGVEVRLDVTHRLPALDVDPTRIRQVLGNLLSNALRHTPSGGEIVVRASAGEAGEVEFAVADSGPGIPPDRVEAIFEPFAKSSDSTGSGLGLAIARDLVQAHGGAITATSRPGGAVFSFRIPVSG